MKLPIKTTTKTGFVLATSASLATFVIIHAAFIFAHEYVNEATPLASVTYFFDEQLEHAEAVIARLKGHDASIRFAVHETSERMHELEEVLSHSDDINEHKEITDSLLDKTLYSIKSAFSEMNEYAKEDENDLHMFTLSLLVESTATDVSRRLRKAEELLAEHSDYSAEQIAAVASEIEQIALSSQKITTAFDIEEEVAQTVRSTVQREVTLRSTTPRLLPIEAEPEPEVVPQCGQKNAACESDSDCCLSGSLSCVPVTTSSGSMEKRCMQTTSVLCRISCEGEEGVTDGQWSDSSSCRLAVAPPDTPSCTDIAAGSACSKSQNEKRNMRWCIKG